VTADATLFTIGPDDHGQRVPPYETSNALLYISIAGIERLSIQRNRIDVRRIRREGNLDAGVQRIGPQLIEQRIGSLRSPITNNVIQGFEPFLRFDFFGGRGLLARPSLHLHLNATFRQATVILRSYYG
jgi:hypothetical protein